MNTRYYFISVTLLCILSSEPGIAQAGLQEFATGFDRPVTIATAGDSRLFVIEQAGRILVIDTAGIVREEPFMDISPRVRSTGNEQGLLGLAFHPDYSENGYLYVNYTNNDGNTVIARFSVSTGDPEKADTLSEYILMTVDQPFTNHNGGDVKFGPDGYLYIGLGDGPQESLAVQFRPDYRGSLDCRCGSGHHGGDQSPAGRKPGRGKLRLEVL